MPHLGPSEVGHRRARGASAALRTPWHVSTAGHRHRRPEALEPTLRSSSAAPSQHSPARLPHLRHEGRSLLRRFTTSFLFNADEAALRLPVLVLLVEIAGIANVLAQGVTLAVAFAVHFVFHARVVYRPRRTRHEPARGAGRGGDTSVVR